MVPNIAGAWDAIDAVPKPLPPGVRIDGSKWMLDGTPLQQVALPHKLCAGRPGWRSRLNYSDEPVREILQTALRRSINPTPCPPPGAPRRPTDPHTLLRSLLAAAVADAAEPAAAAVRA